MLRFAFSPTKDMSVADLRVALFNHILSKQLNEELIIRIDDTNKEQNIQAKDKEILEILNLFSIDYSRVVLQSENIKYHVNIGMKLLLDKKAFNCFCSNEALEQDKQKAKQENKPYGYSGFCESISDETKFNCNAPFVVRSKKPTHNINFSDLFKGDLDYEPFDVDSFVILKQDKTPTYNFASAIDDMLYNISTVIRDEKYLLDTPKQIHIRQSLGYDKELKYIHIPTICEIEQNKQVLKRDNPLSVKWLIDEGYLPIAIANYLILLGYETPKEIFTIEEAINWFDISKLDTNFLTFDIDKLNSINKEHIKNMQELRLSKILGYADEDIGKLAKVYLQECDTIKQIKSKIDAIFAKKELLDDFKEESKILKECLSNAPFINDLEALKKYITQNSSLKQQEILIPLQYTLTGAKSGPDLDRIYPLIKNYLGEIIC